MNDSGSFMNRVPGAGGGNNRTWLYIVIGLAVVCVLCVAGVGILTLVGINLFPRIAQNLQPTVVVQQDQQQTSGSYIEGITLAKDVSGEAFEPVNPTNVFAPQDTIHAVVSVVDVPAGTKFKVVWQVDDVGNAAEPNSQIAEYELEAEGTRNLDFTLSPNNAWPAGSYKGQIYVNGNLAQSFRFTVSQ